MVSQPRGFPVEAAGICLESDQPTSQQANGAIASGAAPAASSAPPARLSSCFFISCSSRSPALHLFVLLLWLAFSGFWLLAAPSLAPPPLLSRAPK
ncbi:hypothetical protein MGYG_08980 [Nannizzia gypsea CBS 118893]|uniref:Uncharacterized protein n=1 Tax=Arthroderma gypseum (strain ATCC MYA-4604 / CBS 118893) TaxID=535722 RepID=E4UMX2_ARTGP|nr:hypothetical protein MGYG_08980 [Nannizzia gypsea CBS 118893]EFQ99486.1 hypothetical protein MGYG_08980 [Nannizzia gypsea CBS 118893]